MSKFLTLAIVAVVFTVVGAKFAPQVNKMLPI